MESFKDELAWERRAREPLRIIIVGAGIGGLSAGIGLAQCGHDVVLLEQVRVIAEVGAGVQIAPNCTRILARLGLLEEIMSYSTLLRKNSLRRWRNDEQLGSVPFMPEIGQKYNAPIGVIHRGDLQKVLLDGASRAGVQIRTSSPVEQVDHDFEPRVMLKSGEWLEGDIVIAADGVKSGIRAQIAAAYDQVDRPLPTGDAAYRALIPRKNMEHDENALALFDQDEGLRWIGPQGHIITYPLRNRGNPVLNLAMLHPQKKGADVDENWNRKGDKSEMLEFYKEWTDTVKNLMSYVPEGEVLEWTLNIHSHLPAWHENKVILMGDACHPMLPYVAQGASQAIEDAGVLAVVFSLIQSKAEIPAAIAVYEHIRKERAERIQDSADTNKQYIHMPDGPEQEARDQKIKAASTGQGQNPDLFSDREWQDFMWGTDVMKQAADGWEQLKGTVKSRSWQEVDEHSVVK